MCIFSSLLVGTECNSNESFAFFRRRRKMSVEKKFNPNNNNRTERKKNESPLGCQNISSASLIRN